MCNWMKEAQNLRSRLGNSNVAMSFPESFIRALPPHTVKQGHCLACGQRLSKQEMYPPGRPPRYMCRQCYDRMAYDTDRTACLWCGDALPPNQVKQRRRNPRELKFGFHQGACLDYHKVLAGLVLGVPFKVAGILTPPQSTSVNPRLPRGQVKYLPFAGQGKYHD